MDHSNIRDIVIIGGGASGALMAWNFVIRHNRTCTVVDPSDRPAFGLAYVTPSMKTQTIGIETAMIVDATIIASHKHLK